MIELFEQQLKQLDRHSSKGNQLKWENLGVWYKADYTGYEGLAEYVTSRLLEYSNLNASEYVRYEIEEIKYKSQKFIGVKSANLLSDDWQIITLERLYKNQFNQSLNTAIWKIRDVKERMKFLCNQTIRITGLESFDQYMTKLMTIDAFFKNEDRHTHNIAILMNSKGEFRLCPIFDNGAALLADTKLDYPMDMDVIDLLGEVKAKTISTDFDEQLDVAEELYGQQLRFYFTRRDVDLILESADEYSIEERERVRTIIYQQMRKYAYLFSDTKSV